MSITLSHSLWPHDLMAMMALCLRVCPGPIPGGVANQWAWVHSFTGGSSSATFPLCGEHIEAVDITALATRRKSWTVGHLSGCKSTADGEAWNFEVARAALATLTTLWTLS